MLSGILTSCGSTEAGLKQASMRIRWLPQAQFAGTYVALEKGFYEDEGIALTVNPGGPNIYATNLVATMSDQFGHVDYVAVTAARDKGLPVKVILAEEQYDQAVLVTHADSGITRPKDFEGKTVAIWFGTLQYQVRGIVAQDDGDPSKVIEVPQGGDLGPFLAREWDVASAMSYNELVTLRDEMQVPINEIWVKDWGAGYSRQGISCADRLLEEDPELVEGFVKASVRGWKYAFENPDEALDIVLKYGPELTREHQKSMLDQMLAAVTAEPAATHGIGYMDPDAVAKTVAFMKDNDLIVESVNPADVYNSAAWDKVPDDIRKI
jgi:NitT/TauT family transport system substrate-binding protein